MFQPRAPPGLPSTPECHHSLTPQDISTQLCPPGCTGPRMVWKGETGVPRGWSSLCTTMDGCTPVRITPAKPPPGCRECSVSGGTCTGSSQGLALHLAQQAQGCRCQTVPDNSGCSLSWLQQHQSLNSVMIPGPSVPRCGSRADSGAQISIFRVNKPQADLILCWCQSCSDLDYRPLLLVFFQRIIPSNNRSEPMSCLGSSLSDPHRHLRQCL